jgi:hypothetical protein
MRRQARSLEDCLSADAGIARLTSHARRLMRLQRCFESATPLARQAQVANFKLGRIFIHARSGAVATKLRQMTPRLADVFRTEAPEVTGIEIRVQPGPNDSAIGRKLAPGVIGECQKQGLTLLANGLPEGSPLQTALRRLVTRAR